jgi:TfoX/Sxy family transcriptional regulator of competence genes
MKIKFKKANPDLSDHLDSVLASFDCEKRKMFGQPAYFVNNNMWTGVFGDEIFLRLSARDQEEMLSSFDDAGPLEPLGRRMKEYVVIPSSLYDHQEEFDKWLNRSYAYVSSLPPKLRKKRRSK